MLRWVFFVVIKVMSNNIFSTYFLMLQILNFNLADIVFGCCNETCDLNCGYLYDAL
jgi:hypothetical protein